MMARGTVRRHRQGLTRGVSSEVSLPNLFDKRSEPEEVVQLAPLEAADVELLPVAERGQVGPPGERTDALECLKVGKGAPAEADELLGVEPGFEILEAIGDGVGGLLEGGQVEQFALGDDRGDLANRDQQDLLSFSDGNALKVESWASLDGWERGGEKAWRCLPCRVGLEFSLFESLLDTVEGLAQASSRNRFQEVVDRVQFKGIDGVIVEGGDESDQRGLLGRQPSDDAQSVNLGHLEVEQSKIGRTFFNHPERFGPIGRLPNEVDILEAAQDRGEKRASWSLIVGDHDPNASIHRLVLLPSAATSVLIFRQERNWQCREFVRGVRRLNHER